MGHTGQNASASRTHLQVDVWQHQFAVAPSPADHIPPMKVPTALTGGLVLFDRNPVGVREPSGVSQPRS